MEGKFIADAEELVVEDIEDGHFGCAGSNSSVRRGASVGDYVDRKK